MIKLISINFDMPNLALLVLNFSYIVRDSLLVNAMKSSSMMSLQVTCWKLRMGMDLQQIGIRTDWLITNMECIFISSYNYKEMTILVKNTVSDLDTYQTIVSCDMRTCMKPTEWWLALAHSQLPPNHFLNNLCVTSCLDWQPPSLHC